MIKQKHIFLTVQKYNINKINKNDILNYISSAKNEDLTFCNKTNLYGLYINEELIAFTGIIIYKNKAIFKNHYVLNKYRGLGYFKILFDFSLKICKNLNIKKVEATCTEMSINHYLKNNFKIIKEYKKYKKVINENI